MLCVSKYRKLAGGTEAFVKVPWKGQKEFYFHVATHKHYVPWEIKIIPHLKKNIMKNRAAYSIDRRNTAYLIKKFLCFFS